MSGRSKAKSAGPVQSVDPDRTASNPNQDSSTQSRNDAGIVGSKLDRAHVLPSLASGSFGALASVFGKLALMPHEHKEQHWLYQLASAFAPTLVVSSACFALLVLCNMLMLSFSLKGLKLSPSTVIVTTLATASNFLTVAVASYFIFGEATQDTLWLTGAFLMMIGTALILKGDTEALKSSNRNEKKMMKDE